MSQTPVPRDPRRDENPSGVPAGSGDYPRLGSPDWQLAPSSPDWDEAYLAAMSDDEDPGDPEEYQDPDHAPPPGLDDERHCGPRSPAPGSGSVPSDPRHMPLPFCQAAPDPMDLPGP